MAKKVVTDAVFARLQANWSTTPILALNETTQTPGDGSAWVQLQFIVANGRQTTLGRTYLETGAFRITIATEIGSGLSKSNDYAEQIATIFRNQKFSGVESLTPTIREGIDEGSYFIAAVIVPFQYEYRD